MVVRLGIVGAGSWAVSNHLPQLALRDDVEVVAVCRPGQAELAEIQQRFGIPVATDDIEGVLSENLDAVIVSSPHRYHYAHAMAALEAGCHVMVEKPMALTAADAWSLVDTAAAHERHLVVPLGWNYSQGGRELDRLLADPGIGRLEGFSVFMASPTRALLTGTGAYHGSDDLLRPDAATWSDPEVAGGGYGYAQLPHALGLVMSTTHERAHRVGAVMSAPGARVDLYDAMWVELVSGAIGTVTGLGTVPERLKWQVDIRLFGSNGMVLYDSEIGRERVVLELEEPNQSQAIELPVGSGDYDCSQPPHEFIDLIVGSARNSRSSGEASARVIEVLDAAYRSAAQGGDPVEVAPRDNTGAQAPPDQEVP